VTPAGQKFLVSVQRFLAAGLDFEKSINEFSSRPAQIIRVGCFAPFGGMLIPPVLRRYIDTNGECEIILREGDQTQLRRWLAAGSLDMVLTYDIGEEFSATITPICKFPSHALMRVDDPLARLEAVSMEELSQRPLVLLDLPETSTYLVTLFDFAARRPKIGLRTRSYETVRVAVVNGLGVSVLNMRPHAGASPDSEQLTRIAISDPLRQPTLIVADPYGYHKPGYVRSFIDILYDYIAELGPENLTVVSQEFKHDLLYPRPSRYVTQVRIGINEATGGNPD
jgi:DNA-binding transcriptional LysR family regulator